MSYRHTAKWAKHLVEASCKKAAKDKKVAEAVWAESLDQVKKGWLRGPFSWEQIDKKYQGTWVPSKRFGVVQGEKTRAVDDLSEFLINSTVSESEKIVLEGIDEIACIARYYGGATVAEGMLSKTMNFGLPLHGIHVFVCRLYGSSSVASLERKFL